MRRALFLVIAMTAIAYGGPVISVNLIGAGTTGPYQLGQKNILLESELVIYHGANLINGSDYRINYSEGYILFTDSIPLADTVQIKFSVVPLLLKSEYILMRPQAANSNDSAIFIPPATSSITDNAGLSLMGSQRFIVNIGNSGEPSLSQSLDLNIAGQLAPQVTVKGSVSDRNFDNVSGSTSSLDELDKILLHLDAPGVRADFGDLELVGVQNSLLDFQRKLTGIDFQAEKSDFSGTAQFAFSPGQQLEFYFFGVDGRQGPYFINAASSAQSTKLIANRFLAGTDEIFLDGNKLTRGSENDYTINYYQGYIEFTPKNVISSRNRITIKIQAADESYRRTFLHGRTFVNKGFDFGAQYIREGDDKTKPRSFDIGKPQSDLLSRVGANADSAYLSGASSVGAGMGDYESRIDSLGDTIYVFVGADSGSYRVSFSYQGQGKGSYQYSGSGKYIYVGEGNGTYAPLVYYPLPQICEYGSLIIRRDGSLFLNSELAISRNDPNTMSTFDTRQSGFGFEGWLGLRFVDRPGLGKSWSGKAFDFRLRRLDSNFRYPGSINPIEFARQYNLPNLASYTTGQLTELRTSGQTGEGDYYDLGGGLVTHDSLKSTRGFGKIGYIVFDNLLLFGATDIAIAEISQSGNAGRWSKYEGGGKFVAGRLQPALTIRHEFKTNADTLSPGFRADEYETGLALDIFDGFKTSGKAIVRNQDYGAPDKSFWRKQYDQYQIEHQMNYNRAGLSLETNLARLYQDASYPYSVKTARNLGSLKFGFLNSAFNFTFYENVNGADRILQTREYIYVGKGKGDYRRDGDDYVAEPGGEYIEIIRQAADQGDGATGYQISGGLRARYDGASSGIRNLSSVSGECDLSYQQNLYPQAGLTMARLFPLGKYDSGELSYRNYNYRQRLKYRLNKRADYVSYTFAASQNKGSQYQFENLESRVLENAVETKFSGGKKVAFLFSARLASDKQTLYSGKVDIDRSGLGITPDFQVADNLRFSSRFDITREQEKVRQIKVTTYSIGPKAIGTIVNVVRIECEIDYSSVILNRENIAIPYILGDGKKPGDNYGLILNGRFKLNRYGNMVLSYNYKKLGDGYTNYNLRAEARAEF